jgi:hypothetical protein
VCSTRNGPKQAIPYWRGLVAEASAHGVDRLCLELHGQQQVYNVRTLFRLRDGVGPVVGANLYLGGGPLPMH